VPQSAIESYTLIPKIILIERPLLVFLIKLEFLTLYIYDEF